MFTGLIQGLGKIRPLTQDLFRLTLSEKIVADLAIGDSVAVDGVCLTVEQILTDGFLATASPETLSRTTLGQRIEGTEYVNIEPSLKVGSKLGGHFVTGHVDGVGLLVESALTERAWEMIFSYPQDIARYLVQKGSIAVNGISLTVAECAPQASWFKVAVIPHTYKETNLSHLKIGDWVNLEADILAKYIDKLIHHQEQTLDDSSEISLEFLTTHGYLS